MILKYSIIIFVTQFIFIGCRTWNIKAISNKNISQVLISSIFVHLSWLITVGIGGISMYEIISNFNWSYLPIVVCSITGSVVGSYVGMINKNK